MTGIKRAWKYGPRWLAAIAALTCARSPALAWELVDNPLPTFARDSGASPALTRPWAAMNGSPYSAAPLPAGYDFRVGKSFVVGVRNWSIPASGLAFSSFPSGGAISGSSLKLGFDMGGGFTPYVSVSHGETRSPFAAAPNGLNAPGNPFAAPATVTTLGAGFDYALTNNLSVGVGFSATQARPAWP